ncbi:MAG: conjugal transfer protein TraG [Firmicutes bacterium]|nr:conjugal transfer protein TraG [Alicyclobacillaceae bacterium]MCL6497673.1 conjugal transfer protein TraG [Bacillota bacterium]
MGTISRWIIRLSRPALIAAWAAMSGWLGLLAWTNTLPKAVPEVWRWGLAVGLTALGALIVPRPMWRWAVGLWLWPLAWPRWTLAAAAVAAAVARWWLQRRVAARPGTLAFGTDPLWGIPVTVSAEDRLLHCHVIGPTGSGKSSGVLLPLIDQDLAAGLGLTLIEPKGDLAGAARSAARRHGRPFLWLDPEAEACPHWNPLTGPAEAAAEGLDWALLQLQEPGHPYYAATSRVLLLYAVRALKAALGDAADLLGLVRFLRRPEWRRECLAKADPATREYFREQWGQWRADAQAQTQSGLLHRLELLLANPHLSRVLAPPSDFDWDTVLKEGWTVLAPLSPARLGASARALGVLWWHGLMLATYRRPMASRPYFLYLDEFHQYVSPDLNEFLALARGYGVGLILAHQDMGQLSAPLQAALGANARQRVALSGLSPHDCQWLEAQAAPHRLPVSPRYLPRGLAVVQCTRQGRLEPPRVVRLPHHRLGAESTP